MSTTTERICPWKCLYHFFEGLWEGSKNHIRYLTTLVKPTLYLSKRIRRISDVHNHALIIKMKKLSRETSPLNISSNDSGWLGAESGNILLR